jgi:hypothetical protein
MFILLAILFLVPMLGAQLGLDLGIVMRAVDAVTGHIIDAIVYLTGN